MVPDVRDPLDTRAGDLVDSLFPTGVGDTAGVEPPSPGVEEPLETGVSEGDLECWRVTLSPVNSLSLRSSEL